MTFMEAKKNTSSKEHYGNHKKAIDRNKTYRDTSSVYPVTVGRNNYCRSMYRSNVIKQATASKKSAIAFLAKAGILDKNGELTSLYK